MSKQYCSRCKKMTEARDYGAGPFCSKCFHYFDSRREAAFTEESSGNASQLVELRERARPLLDEKVAEIQLRLEDFFRGMGLDESAAREAARGRDGLGESVMEIARIRRAAFSDGALEEASIADTFKEFGLNEAEAKIAAKGRDVAHFLSDGPVFTDAEINGWTLKEDKPDNFDAVEIEGSLAESFVRLGLGEGAAKVAAQGRG